MQYIQKRKRGPASLRKWFNNQPKDSKRRRINCDYYKDMPAGVKIDIRQYLLEDQGGLCCYTGIVIDMPTSHIEHFKTYSKCKLEGQYEDVAYSNLLAAYPNGDCPFGAKARQNCDESLLVNPMHKSCEGKFQFDSMGNISVANKSDAQAKSAIEKLKLDHPQLTSMRKQAIYEVLFTDDLSKAKLNRIIQGYGNRDSSGSFRAFCFAIVQVAKNLLREAERDRKRRQAIHQQLRR